MKDNQIPDYITQLYQKLFDYEALKNMIEYRNSLKKCKWEIDETKKENLFAYGMDTYP